MHTLARLCVYNLALCFALQALPTTLFIPAFLPTCFLHVLLTLPHRTRTAVAAAVGAHHVAESGCWNLTAAPPPDSLLWSQLGLRGWQVGFRRGLVKTGEDEWEVGKEGRDVCKCSRGGAREAQLVNMHMFMC